ncbi:MAG: LPS biosynthesis protein WbpP, partial [Nitrospinota bacterium]
RITLNDLFRRIGRSAGNDITPRYGEPRKGDVKHSLADVSKAKEYLTYDPEFSIEKGIERSVEWYRERMGKGGK